MLKSPVLDLFFFLTTRINLKRKLIKQKFGVAEVEEFCSDLAETHRNTKYKSIRKTKLIVSVMRDKLRDSLEERRIWRGQKASTIKKIHQVWGEKAIKTKSLISDMIRSCRKLRKELAKKHDQKVMQLDKKFRKKQVKSSLSEDLDRYSSVKCLQSDFIPPELEANTQPLVFGGVHLDSDESAAMLLVC